MPTRADRLDGTSTPIFVISGTANFTVCSKVCGGGVDVADGLPRFWPAFDAHPPRPPTDGSWDWQVSIAGCSCGEFDRDAGVVHFAARECRVGKVRLAVGADALAPNPATPAVGRRRAAGRQSSTAMATPCRPAAHLRNIPEFGQSPWPVPVASVGGSHRVGEIRDAVAAYTLRVSESLRERRRPRRSRSCRSGGCRGRMRTDGRRCLRANR